MDYKLSIIVALSIGLVITCNVLRARSPQLTPEVLHERRSDTSCKPILIFFQGHGGWNYGTYTTDNNTDNQMSHAQNRSPTLYQLTAQWKLGLRCVM